MFLSIIQFAAQQPRTFRLVSQPRTHKLPLSEQGTEAAELKSENAVSTFSGDCAYVLCYPPLRVAIIAIDCVWLNTMHGTECRDYTKDT